LEPTFIQTVNTAMDYHVFLTPNGDSRGLYVVAKTATFFEVREQGGGTSDILSTIASLPVARASSPSA
jgi:hypothetical protein